jgi:hypothetical protein
MNKEDYTVDITINGRSVAEHSKNGKTYIEAKDGSNYAIKIRNNSWKTIKAVVTVDGFSVINDDKNDYNTGYIIKGHTQILVKGFRTSDDTEAEFTFTTKGDSRAQKVQGYAKDSGVIGVRVFEEKENLTQLGYKTPYISHSSWNDPDNLSNRLCKKSIQSPGVNSWETDQSVRSLCASASTEPTMGFMEDEPERSEQYSCNNIPRSATRGALFSMSAVAAPEPQANFDMGSKMGKDVQSRSVQVEFATGRLAAQFEVYYAYRKSLTDIGIDFRPKKEYHTPNAFESYCKRPK